MNPSNHADKQYLDLCRKILAEGTRKDDRTGTGVISYFGHQFRFNLAEGFPLLTTKRLPFRIITEELLWFLRGETNIKSLLDKGVNIWNADAYRDYLEQRQRSNDPMNYEQYVDYMKRNGHDLGPIYGAQWRSWAQVRKHFDVSRLFSHATTDYIDQIAHVIESIRSNPNSRRHIVSAWNVGELDEMALPPCHTMFQFYVADGRLSCQLYQRSADVFLGLPFNIASYSLLTHMIADITGYEVGEFIHTLGDSHIYLNHINQVRTQIGREPRELPKLNINRKVDDPSEYSFDDFELVGYDPHPKIKGDVSVG